MTESEFIEIPPDIERIVEGFRDIGYTFPVAIADLVDNSIEADASVVNINVAFGRDGKPAVSIADDGCGMDREGLLNAMKYGAASVDDPRRLGRFGLGLKTASTGFCRCLTLVSTPGDGVPEVFATWDLDLVAEENKWIYEIGDMRADQSDALEEERDVLEGLSGARPDKGTLVIWDKVDRLLVRRHGGEYANPSSALRTKTMELRDHLGLVFQRYLDPDDDRATDVVIAVNGERIEPMDPFCERWEQVKPELMKKLLMATEDGEDRGEVLVRGFILPKPNDINDPAYGPQADISAGKQGIYWYRENRLIEGPGWLPGFRGDTHLNHLRIEVSYQANHDDLFIVDIKKKDLKLDAGLAEVMEELLPPIRTEANNRSRGKGQPPRIPPGGGKTPTGVGIDKHGPGLEGPEVTVDGSSVMLDNNRGTTVVRGPDGNTNIQIRIDDEGQGKRVEFADALPHAVLWEPSLGGGDGNTQVTISITHDWYKKTYLPNADNGNFVEAIEYLFFALAMAELNNTDLLQHQIFGDFRVEVSRNLNRLVSDLPEHEPGD